jgi:tetratricopeptide (TPR) repeat protein
VTLIALQADLENFRVAARWTVDKQQLETGLRLMAGLWRFMEVRAYYTEGLARAKEILALRGTEAFPELTCKLLAGAGMLAYRMAKYEDAHRLFQSCLEIANTRDDKVGMAEALGDLGLVAMMKGDFPQAQEFQTRCKELEQLNQNARNVAVANYNLGFLALGMGSYSDAAGLLSEALQEFESAGNDRESAFALNSLARCCIVSGDLDTANQYSERALAIRRKLLDGKCVADSLRTSAWAALEAGRDSAAMDQLKEAIGLARGVDDSRGVSEALDLFALTVARPEPTVNLVVLAAAAEHIRGPYGYALPPALIAERTKALARAKELLGEMEYGRAWDRGTRLTIPDAINEAVQTAAGVSAA